jgi:hypothetical protein
MTHCVELRNHIYEYAVETPSDFCCFPAVPPLLVHHSPQCTCDKNGWPVPDHGPSTRRFYALTQVCKQVRLEYRPLWLRNSCIRIKLRDLKCFLRMFYTKDVSTSLIAPKLVQVSWDHDTDYEEDQILDLTPLFKLYASCPTLKVEFVCHAVVEGQVPDLDYDDDCDICLEEFIDAGYDPEAEPEALADWECYHEDLRSSARFETWLDDMLDDEYGYLPYLNQFLSHRNEQWLADIRKDRIKHIGLKMKTHDADNVPEIHIQLSAEAAVKRCDENTLMGSARAFLENVGIMDSVITESMEFHVSCTVW